MNLLGQNSGCTHYPFAQKLGDYSSLILNRSGRLLFEHGLK